MGGTADSGETKYSFSETRKSVFVYVKRVCISPHPGATLLVPALRDAGLRIILSSMLTISGNFGRAFLSFCQQSSISWCSTTGQSMGAGSLKSCSMAFITWDTVREGRREKRQEGKTQRINSQVSDHCLVLRPTTFLFWSTLAALKRQADVFSKIV